MNINKLFEGQRHDDKEIMYILSKNGISRMFYPDLVEVNLMKQYAEHFLVKFLDSEIERLEKELYDIKKVDWGDGMTSDENAEDDTKSLAETRGWNNSIKDQVTYLQDIKRQLTESK